MTDDIDDLAILFENQNLNENQNTNHLDYDSESISTLNTDDELDEKDWENLFNNSKGSLTAKNGFKEEEYIRDQLNNNINIREGFEKLLDIKLEKEKEKENDNTDSDKAKVITGNKKTDIRINNINIQHKKTKLKEFGQVDRHYVSYLIEKIPELKECETMLKKLCELPIDKETNLCDENSNVIKLDNTNYSTEELNKLINIIEANKEKIIKFAFLGYEEEYKPNVLSISLFDENDKRKKIIFWKMDDVIDYLVKCENSVKIRDKKTVIEISKGLTFQRKGGDGGKKAANQFQFKFVPSDLPLDKAFVFECSL
jgi:hypothetical protein